MAAREGCEAMQGTYGNGQLVTVFGGSGFLGRHVVRALAIRGYRVRAASRRPDLAGHLRPLGMVGQIQPVQANLRFPESIRAVMQGAVAAVNLVGILAETRRQSFAAIHAEGAKAVADIAAAEGVERLVHVSALGAAADSMSRYFRTKAEGEAGVRAEFPTAVIVRPSVQFGVGDSFFNRFAAMARLSPVLPIVGPNARFQPVYAGDVAEVIARAVDGDLGAGVYELGGPETLTFRETMQLMLATIERRRPIVAVPFGIARIVAPIAQILPGRLLTSDQVRQLRYDAVVSPAAEAAGRTLVGLGMRPTTLAAILPTYLSRFRARGEFSVPHDAAG